MDAVPTPMSAPAPQIAVPGIDASAVNPAAYSPTPALDALQTAYQKGLVNASDIMSLSQQGTELQKNRAVSAADIQQAKLHQQTQPEAAKAEIAGSRLSTAASQAGLGNVPIKAQAEASTAGATIAQSDAEKAAAALTKQTAEGHMPIVSAQNLDALALANRQKVLDTVDPSGALSTSANALASWGVSTPQKADGSVDTATLRQEGQLLLRNQNMLKFGVFPDLVKQAAGKQGGLSLLFNPDMTIKNPIQAAKDVADALPQQSLDDRNKAVSQLQMINSVSEVAPHILSILNNPNPRVGPRAGEGGDVTRTVNQARAFISGNPEIQKLVGGADAVSKLNDQQVLQMYLANQIQSTIRSLAGSGNRVMQAEVNPQTGLFYTAMPKLTASPEVWKTWLGNQFTIMKNAAEEAQTPMNPEDQTRFKGLSEALGAQATAFGGAGQVTPAGTSAAKSSSVPRFMGLESSPTANTPEEAAKLPPNTWYNFNGQPALTPP